eukprot:TRINITY_DN1794_c0_g1_i1.p1 TRINITY_DN1794_c0_g1~~TRINITY_DN1794_c0_g1_i1.p1  ORF type:complete len:366 (-),score=67.43 TRINITY_DN1794_c0_g1_i1:97-1194(-)
MSMDLITFNSPISGGIKVAAKYINKANLVELFQFEDPLLLDHEGEDVNPNEKGEYENLNPSLVYTVIDESMVTGPGEEPQIKYDRSILGKIADARMNFIKRHYKPLHPSIYTLTPDLLDPVFVDTVEKYKASGCQHKAILMSILTLETPQTGLFSFRMFSDEFSRKLIEEVDHFQDSGLPVNRPNTMNRYGAILDDMGFEQFFTDLREQYVKHFAAILYPHYGGASLDSHHAFIVQYKLTGDKKLNFHYDDSEVTINACLGKEFTGGSLYFSGLLEDPETHTENYECQMKKGLSLFHIGHHRHGANNILSGERYNLIVWFRSSKYRAENHHLFCKSCGSKHKHSHSDGEKHDHEHKHEHSHSDDS